MMNEIWDGKYEILSKLGSGGTSLVYKARRLADDKEVAIKVIRDDLDNIKENERRFRLEAEALSKMSHRNIRRILNVGQWNENLYMVTEYVDGQTLKDMLKSGPLPKKKALDFALQIAAGLEHAHRKSIVHRDIKPQNILIAKDGTAKIADFGIAHMSSQTTRTMPGKDVIGSVHYISPEQASGDEIDERSDIYSFGVLMYEMFVGHVPFDGNEAVALAMKHIHQLPEEPYLANDQLEKGLSDLILKCMQKKPDERYQTVAELREDLLLYAANPKGFSVLQSERLQRGGQEEKPEEYVPRRRPYSTEKTAPQKRNSFYNEEDHARALREKRKRMFGIALGVLLSAAVIALTLVLLLPRILPEQTYEQKKVPSVASLTRNAATAVLRGESFSKYRVEEEYSVEVAEGSVIRTEPAEGSVVPVNTEIVLYVSKGATSVLAVNTIGRSVEDAANALREQGFEVKIEYITDAGKPNGVVTEQSNSTQAIPLGSTVTLKVVRNIEARKLVVPDLYGKSLEEAREAITQAGFHVGRYQTEMVDSRQTLGVVWQSEPAGKEYLYQDGDKVPEVEIDFTVNVSSGYKCVYDYAVPNDEPLDLELIVYNLQGDEIAKSKYSGTNHVTYEYKSSSAETVVFELYSDNTRINKQELTTEASRSE